MSNEPVNPYSTPAVVVDDRTRLKFDAVIEERDYAQLLSDRDFEWLLYAILLALLSITTLLVLVGVVVGLALQGWDNVVIPVIVVGGFTAAGTLFVIRFRRPIRRARRNLKRFPDLLGVGRGELTESGLVFHDGERQHWFGPQRLLASKVCAAGIRIRFDDDPRRFLALTPRMFDHYSEQVAARIQQGWRKTVADMNSTDTLAGLEAWQQVNPRPEDAVAFYGTVTLQQSLRTPQVRKAATIELGGALLVLMIGILGVELLWLRFGLLAYAIFCLTIGVRSWWRYFRGTLVESWTQRGWVSCEELAILRQPAVGTRFALSEIRETTDQGAVITLTGKGEATYYLARDHVASDNDWSRIKQRCQNPAAERNLRGEAPIAGV